MPPLDDFLVRALLGGLGIALVAGPLGCFVAWRRMAYFGDTLAHASLLGVALGFLLSVDPLVGILGTCAVVAVSVVLLQEQRRVATDTLLGLMSHSALALGLVVLGLLPGVRVDLSGLLFGDILSVSPSDLAWIWGGGAAVLAGLAWLWRPLLALTVHEEMARAEGIPTLRVRLVFTLLLAGVVAIAMKVVGILLITAMLILPAAAARPFSTTPERMALLAALAGAAAVGLGLWGSLALDTPAGPSVVVSALVLFLAGQAASLAGGRRGT
nr:iron chelate uptake ABC transporter family permease subunit [Arenibaculum pallidiluteum]